MNVIDESKKEDNKVTYKVFNNKVFDCKVGTAKSGEMPNFKSSYLAFEPWWRENATKGCVLKSN